MIRFIGHSDGKVIIPDEPVTIPSDRALQITVQDVRASPRGPSSRAELLRIAEEAEAIGGDLPSDLAAQHDHYLYGTPKR